MTSAGAFQSLTMVLQVDWIGLNGSLGGVKYRTTYGAKTRDMYVTDGPASVRPPGHSRIGREVIADSCREAVAWLEEQTSLSIPSCRNIT